MTIKGFLLLLSLVVSSPLADEIDTAVITIVVRIPPLHEPVDKDIDTVVYNYCEQLLNEE